MIRLVRARFQKVLEPGRRRRAIRREFARETIRELLQLPAVLGELQKRFDSFARYWAALCTACCQIDPNRGKKAITRSAKKRIPELAKQAETGKDSQRSPDDVLISLISEPQLPNEAYEGGAQQPQPLSPKDSGFGAVTMKPQKERQLKKTKHEPTKDKKDKKREKKPAKKEKERERKEHAHSQKKEASKHSGSQSDAASRQEAQAAPEKEASGANAN